LKSTATTSSKEDDMERGTIQKIAIIAVVVAGLLFLYWKFDYSKNAKNIKTLKVEYDNLNTQVNEARKVAARMSEYIKRIKVLEAQLKIANKMLPDSQKLEDVIDTITLVANRNNLKIMSIKPLTVSGAGDYSCMTHELSVTGTYNTLGQFLTDMGNQSRIYKIDNLVIKPTKKNDDNIVTITSILTLASYYKGEAPVQTEKKGGKK